MLTLLDTGFAVALFHQNDWHHQAVLQVVQQLRGTIVFPVPAITETVYLLRREAGNKIATQFIAGLTASPCGLKIP
jgi:predicted nucleic acid-binding protein